MLSVIAEFDEDERLAELRSLKILDTELEQEYDDITFLASLICQTPIALVSFVDETRQWFKSRRGIDASETPRPKSFCDHAIVGSQDVFSVEDSRIDERFRQNPLVVGTPNIVFYAGATMVSERGHPLGTVCVIDQKPRVLTSDQEEALRILARHVTTLLQLRKRSLELEQTRDELQTQVERLDKFAMVVAHDIKSPLTNIMMTNDLLVEMEGDTIDKECISLLEGNTASAHRIQSLIDGVLSYSRSIEVSSGFEDIDLATFFSEMGPLISQSSLNVEYEINVPLIRFNRVLLEQVFLNLINNSIRYNESSTPRIDVVVNKAGQDVEFTVTDNGIGIPSEHLAKIFDLFERGSNSHDGEDQSHGIGLATVKRIVTTHHGTIRLESEVGKGTSVIITLPLIKDSASE